MARRPKSPQTSKTHRVTVRLPSDIHAQLTAAAADAGMTVTDLITTSIESRLVQARPLAPADTVATQKDVAPIPPGLFAELQRIGHAVNEIAHVVNVGMLPDARHAFEQVERLYDVFTTEELAGRRSISRASSDPHSPTKAPLPSELFAEFRRIANNVNQIAQAPDSGLPSDMQHAYRQIAKLFDLFIADELSVRRKSFRNRTTLHGATHPQTGNELQGSVQLYPARPGQEDS